MRKALLLLGLAAAWVGAGNGSGYVAAINDAAGIYTHMQRQLFETPVLKVNRGDQLQVLGEAERFYKVQSANGTSGWIEKQLVRKVSSKSINFREAIVEGYIETPNSVLIFGNDSSEPELLTLKRSFKESLSENIDHETASRLTDE